MIILIWLFNHSFKTQFVTKIYHKEDKSHSLYINWGILWKHLVIIIKHFFCYLATLFIDSDRQVDQHVKYVKAKYSNITCIFDFPGFLMIEVWNYHNKVYNQTRKCKRTRMNFKNIESLFHIAHKITSAKPQYCKNDTKECPYPMSCESD